jgi:hypothetical protein
MDELWAQLHEALREWDGRQQPPTHSQRIAALETIARIDRLARMLFELRLRVEQELRDADRPTGPETTEERRANRAKLERYVELGMNEEDAQAVIEHEDMLGAVIELPDNGERKPYDPRD